MMLCLAITIIIILFLFIFFILQKKRCISWLDSRFNFSNYFIKIQNRIHRQLPYGHIKKYELKCVWYWYPFYCLGGITLVSFVVLAITGIFLGFYYVPTEKEAYESIEKIMFDVPLGYMMRSIHHWAAHIMVASVVLHTFRVYFTGAYKKPREFNWCIGVILLILTIFFAYSGYLLPWDELSYWAANIGLNMLLSIPFIGGELASLIFGGSALSGGIILRMYVYHVY
ncbi:MAG: cytochrome b N-terminal domain-containing protein, partial [Candidatus Thermoplasmatota archaeon]